MAVTEGALVTFVPSERERADVNDLARPGDDGFGRLAAADAVCGLTESSIAGPMAGIREVVAFPDQAG